jgi:protein-disulfide isomerase
MSKAARERSARERLAEERKRQAARDKQRKLLAIVIGAVVAVAAVVVVTVIVMDRQGKSNQKATAYTGPQAPLSRQADGSIVMAKAGVTAPTLDVFEDFQCPACKAFEDSTGKNVKQLAAEGKVKVVYRPFHLFGQQPDPVKRNSLASAAAALCVPADKWLSYHDALYKYQPEEGTKGFANKELVNWGKDVGVTDSGFDKCVTDQQKKDQVTSMTSYALETKKVNSTPTLFLNDRKLDSKEYDSGDAIAKAIAEAGKKTTK